MPDDAAAAPGLPAGPLVAVDQAAAALAAASPPVVLDARWQLGTANGRAWYQDGHLPGAVFVDVDRDLSGPPGQGGRHPLPTPADFQAAMRRCGIRDGHPVVVYDQGDSGGAARAWWLLTAFGHGAVWVLDGGFRAWVAAGLPVTGAESRPGPGDFTARPGRRPVLDAAGAAALAGTGVLLDVRTAARYAGREEPVDPVAGHVPGARNLPAGELYAADGRLRPPAELRARFVGLGVRDGVPAGVSCGSGIAAAQGVLALEATGFAGVLWPGSWSEWITDPARPVAPTAAGAPGASPGGKGAPTPASGRLHHLLGAALRADTAQTAGMRRAAAVSGATVGSEAIWMGETRVAPSTVSAPHHHGHSETAIYVVRGNPAFVFLDGEEEVRIETRPGDYVFVPPFVPHREENPSAEEEAVVVIARSTQEAVVVNLDSLRG
jgi:thiosulfate/3-mercaptopyruvate sulfurtransferase